MKNKGRFKQGDKRTLECSIKGNLKSRFKPRDKRTVILSKKGFQARLKKYPNMQSDYGRRSRKRENKIAKKIKNQYDLLFQPFEVCDRIAIKKGKIIFIEIKKKKDKLKPKQLQFKKICEELKITYEVIRD